MLLIGIRRERMCLKAETSTKLLGEREAQLHVIGFFGLFPLKKRSGSLVVCINRSDEYLNSMGVDRPSRVDHTYNHEKGMLSVVAHRATRPGGNSV